MSALLANWLHVLQLRLAALQFVHVVLLVVASASKGLCMAVFLASVCIHLNRR